MALEHEIPDALIRAAQRGDAAALSQLLERVRPRAYRWALVQTGSPDDAEDIVQDALLRVTRGLGSYAFTALFTTWMHSIVRSTAADLWRTRRRRELLLRERAPQPTVAVQPESPSALVDIVRQRLGDLTARQREVLDLVDLRGHTPAEAAVLLSMNATTLRVHLLRARRRMRLRILEEHPYIREDAV